MSPDIIALAIVMVVVTVAFVVANHISLREAERRHTAELERMHAAYVTERGRLGERVVYLEFQLANHVAHVLKLPPPAPPIGNGPKPELLPEVVQHFLDAIDDAEARLEYEGDFRTRLALGADPHKLVAEAMSA